MSVVGHGKFIPYRGDVTPLTLGSAPWLNSPWSGVVMAQSQQLTPVRDVVRLAFGVVTGGRLDAGRIDWQLFQPHVCGGLAKD